MPLERVIGRIHARIHAKPNDIAGRVANLKVRPTLDVGLSGNSGWDLSEDNTLRVWDVESGQRLGMIAFPVFIITMAMNYPQIVIGLNSGKVHFLEIRRLELE